MRNRLATINLKHNSTKHNTMCPNDIKGHKPIRAPQISQQIKLGNSINLDGSGCFGMNQSGSVSVLIFFLNTDLNYCYLSSKT